MIISRYIIREVLTSLFAVTIVLLSAFLSQQIVRYLNYVAVGKVSSDVMLTLVGFEVPYLLALLLPLGLYLGILLGFGRLYANNEMTIMQMSGFNQRRIRRVVMFLGVVVAGFVLYLMLWINPSISLKRQSLMQTGEATTHLIETLIPGRFQASPDGKHVMYVEELTRDRQKAKHVFLAQQVKDKFGKHKKEWMLVLAKQGYQQPDPHSKDQFFVTTDGYRYEGIPGKNDYKIIQFSKYAVRIPQKNPRVLHKEVESLSSWQLLKQYSDPNSAAELQWRVSIPLSAFLLGLLALPMSVRKPRQGSRYLILLPAIVIYVCYINMLSVARHWVEDGALPISIGMWWVHGIMLGVVLLAFWYRQRRRG